MSMNAMSTAISTLNSVLSPQSSILHLVTDSRTVQPGDTFVAYPGEKIDGRRFISQAIAGGANAVIYDTHNYIWDDGLNIPHLGMQDLRHKAGWIADEVYGKPSEQLWMVGVTGTNGKTSTCHWIAEGLNNAGKKCALIGTLGNGFAGSLQATVNTTPDAIQVHRLLSDYLGNGGRAVAMEVSSHALAQGRVNGVRFDVALLTNLSRDHLDYHGDMESYAAAKCRLFDWQELKYAVVNLDDAFGVELALQLRDKEVEVVAYGLSDVSLKLAERHGLRMVYGNLQTMNAQGMALEIYSSWGGGHLNSTLVGRFNAANLMGALAVLLVSDVPFNDAVLSLSRVLPVSGRMQRIGGNGQPTVIVDYAHTPDALEKVLLALREACAGVSLSPNSDGTTSHSTKALENDAQVAGYLPKAGDREADSLRESDVNGGRLICVFGCGGDRDRGKRAMMGRVAEKFSDICIVTSDNPRSEDPQEIIDEVTTGMSAFNHEVVVDRMRAIERAISLANRGDTVLVAGKGHEDYQEIAGVKHHFSDVDVVEEALKHGSWQQGGVQ
ncbi:MAG: UDP-N-acetylmuramoyl-L-alanyl-D-glutamate--2,6-diaminopimelate ligase [Gallionella sp.]|jgi:UDP-N-acetylmuramoyl-L-alanyl-D-glutamate--2,6-diaminopimelate ligase